MELGEIVKNRTPRLYYLGTYFCNFFICTGMSTSDSITAWINDLKIGDEDAVQQLWNRYYSQLVHQGWKKLAGQRCRTELAEEAALSAFASFCRSAKEGRYPELGDRNSLWRLLLKITVDKALGTRRNANALKRGGGRIRGESALVSSPMASEIGGIASVVGNEPTPELVAIMTEQFEQLLERLGSDELQTIAIAKMEGYTNGEIAARLNCAKRTIERRLNLICRKWQLEADGR
jgi:DNA-directed RNA polymerase specialized sigma24 family protein